MNLRLNGMVCAVLTTFIALLVAVPAQATSPFPVSQSFRDATVSPEWRLSNSASLTAASGR